MAVLDSILIAVAAIVLWCLLLYVLQSRGLLERRGLSPSPPPAGPFLMWKTVRGRQLIDRIARRNVFWRWFGDLAIVLVAVTMVGTTVLLLWEATLVQSSAVRANPPSPELLLGLPGINPIIPLGYGIFGLAVAIILHEFSHGILARVAKIRIRSLGLIFLIFPIGAFVEPEEEELRALPRRDRAHLFAAGPAMNIVLAVLFAVITNINGTEIHTFTDFTSALARAPLNQSIPVVAYDPSTGGSATYSVILTERRADTGRAVLGILAFDMDTSFYHPLTNPDRFNGIPGAVLSYISLPFQGRSPIDEPTVRFYRVTGLAAAVPGPLFWLLVNTAYWLFWLNAMLGATNALPAVPLDGGYIFKDGVEGLLSRIRKGISTEQRDRIVTNVSRAFAFLILGLVVWQFIGPRI